MSLKKITTPLLILGLELFIMIPKVQARVSWGSCLESDTKGNNDIATISCIVPLFQNIALAVSTFVGIVLLVVVITAGFTFLTAGSDPKRLEKAKGTISSALLGIVIVALAYLIIRFIGVFTGTSVVLEEFKFPGAQNLGPMQQINQ